MKTLLTTLTLLFCISAFGQRVHIGGQIGQMGSTTKGDGSISNSTRIRSITGGIHIDYKIKPDLMFSTGIFHRRKGFSTKVFLTDETGINVAEMEQYFRTNYISVPFRIGIVHDKKLVLKAHMGLSVSYLVNGYTEVRTLYSTIGEPGAIYTNFIDHMKRIDLALSYEMSVGYKINDRFIPHITYGLERSVMSTSTRHPMFKNAVYNSNIIAQFGISYILPQKTTPRAVPTNN